MKNGNKDFTVEKKEAFEEGIHFAHNFTPEKRGHLRATERTVFWESETTDAYGVLSLTEAQELIEVLQAIIADYPKEPTNEEILNELPNGSIIQFDDEKSRWVKTNSGILLSGDTSMEGDDLSIYEDMKITVKYRGDE